MINRTLKLYALVIITITIFFISHTSSAWELDAKRSSVSCVCIKKTNIDEPHHFIALSEKVDQCIAVLSTSVDSRAPIWKASVYKFLFRKNIYSTIEVKASLGGILGKQLMEIIDVPASLQMNESQKR